MIDPVAPVEVRIRIPGNWANQFELRDRLPAGCHLSPETLTLPDSSSVEFIPKAPDHQFAEVFRTSLRRPASADELAVVRAYTVNACVCGPGGSLPAALKMMEAASALISAGGAGVFIDNCGLAFGGSDWLAMTEAGDSDAISFAFVAIVGGKSEVYTIGMHVLGLRDILMNRSDLNDDFDIVDMIRYLARGEKPVGDGHVIADLTRLRFRVMFMPDGPAMTRGSLMDNPFGRMKLVSMREESETN